MLNYASLSSKPEMSRQIDGKKVNYKDLLCHTLNDEEPVFEGITFIEVIEDYVARPDLISLAVYGDDKFGDLICKYNGISNPFEMNENDVLLIPDFNEFGKFIDKSEKKSELVSDSSEIIRDKKYKFQKEKDEKRAPADSVIGEENYVIDKSLGVIFY